MRSRCKIIGIQSRINGRNRMASGTMNDVPRLAIGVIRRREGKWQKNAVLNGYGALFCEKMKKNLHMSQKSANFVRFLVRKHAKDYLVSQKRPKTIQKKPKR